MIIKYNKNSEYLLNFASRKISSKREKLTNKFFVESIYLYKSLDSIEKC